MNDDSGVFLPYLSKILGAGAGNFIALVFIPPKTLREFASRVTVALIIGVIFAHPVREYLGWSNDGEHLVASSAAAAFISWWVLGVIVRALNTKNDLSKL